MTLYIDVGNTHTVFGIKLNGEYKRWRLSTGRYETEDEVYSYLRALLGADGIDPSGIDSVVVSSVVPSLDITFERLSRKFLGVEALFVVADEKCGVKWPVENPKEIGADRVANVVGAYHEYGKDGIILDFGTAVTVDVLYDGEFLGGSISPGIFTMMYSLFKSAAKLPLINLEKIPETSIGRNTEDNIRIGILKMLAYGLNGIVDDVKKELAKDMKVIVTGGQASLVLDILKHDIYDPDLTIKGMEWYKKLHEEEI